MNIILHYRSMPCGIKAFTRENTDGSYVIFINTLHSHETQMHAVLHELCHIQGNDFSRDEQADLLEKMLHGYSWDALDLSQFEFFVAA